MSKEPVLLARGLDKKTFLKEMGECWDWMEKIGLNVVSGFHYRCGEHIELIISSRGGD